MTMIRITAVTALALGALTLIDMRPSVAETYRPWCAQYTGSTGARTCSFSSFQQCMMTAGPGTGAKCVQNPFYLTYGPGSPELATTAQRRRTSR